jgi:uncharacterized membrane protein YccC
VAVAALLSTRARAQGIAEKRSSETEVQMKEGLMRWRRSFFLAALLCPLVGHTAAPEAPDPTAWARLNPQDQAVRRAELKQQLKQATPQERAAFRSRLRERLEDLTPQQRQALADQTRERWRQLDPEEKQRLLNERRERVRAMSPEERAQLVQQRREMLGKLSPAERAALREKLSDR